MIPKEFLTNFLYSRQLENANGLALFRYKIKEFEFAQLNDILKQRIHVNDMDRCACFVLYAAEQWRQSYNGGHWNWDLILNPIGAINLSTQDIYSITRKGLRYWKRNLFVTHNNRCAYLGTIYREAGIPSQVLADGGVMTTVVIEAFKKFNSVLITDQNPEEIIAFCADRYNLADALKTEVTYSLLNETVNALSKLKTEYVFDHSVNPIQFLNEHHPNWKGEFPFKVDDVGQNFITGIFSGIKDVKAVVENHVQLERVLDLEKGIVDTVINCEKGFRSVGQLGISEMDFQNLSKRCKLVLESESGRREVTELYKTNKDSENGFLFSNKVLNRSLGQEAYKYKWDLKISCEQTATALPLTMTSGEKIDEWTPWIFVLRENKWVLKTCSGSARISGREAIIVVMAEAAVECSNSVLLGFLGRDRKILKSFQML